MQKLKVNDSVQVLAGKDKGKQGKVKSINFKTNRVVVEGVNVFKKSIKPNQTNQQGGLIDIEKGLHISNVAVVDAKTGKPTRVAIKKIDGKPIRVSVKTKTTFK